MFRSFTFRSLTSSLLAVPFVLVFLGLASQAVAQTPVRIMPLGDSITSSPGCWRAYLWNRLQTAGHTNIDFVGSSNAISGCGTPFTFDENHEGHSGFSITGIADQNQLPPWLTAARPDIIVMHLGTNDMWGGHIPLATKITALTKLIGQMRAFNPNIKLVAAKIIPMDAAGCTTCMGDVVAFNNALANLAASLTTAQSPIFVADLWTGFDVVNDTFDRVHPLTSGFIKMGDRFFPAVAQALGGTSNTFGLTVTVSGPGAVSSTPAGILCGGTCSAQFASGTSVNLLPMPTPGLGSMFTGWSGACTGTGPCTVLMTQARAVTATFVNPTTFPLSVTKMGSGTGTVTSTPSGINCGTLCTANFAAGATVTLNAVAGTSAVFNGWGGACAATTAPTCTVLMAQARNVTATFEGVIVIPGQLSVIKQGTGTGTVTSVPSGIDCGTICVVFLQPPNIPTSIRLIATPAPGSVFAGWGGACSGTGPCVISPLPFSTNVFATFDPVNSFPLSFTGMGTGFGSVRSTPAGLACAISCTTNFAAGTIVTLTATNASDSVFVSWGGACSGTAPTCTVSMTQARNVTATFNSSNPGGTCPNPITFTGNTGNFNTTGAACYRTSQTINGWGCYNFQGRTLTVGGVARTCGQMPLTRAADGYYYFAATAGQFPYAGIFAW